MFLYDCLFRNESEVSWLMNEVKKNPLALELLQKINADRKIAGRPLISVKIVSGLKFRGDCCYATGLIRLLSDDLRADKLQTLVYEICNLDTTLNLYRRVLERKVWSGQYPIRRSVYIKEGEKFGQLAGVQMLRIYRYGVKHLGWDSEILDECTIFFKKPFRDYFALDTEHRRRHKETHGSYWDEVVEGKKRKRS